MIPPQQTQTLAQSFDIKAFFFGGSTAWKNRDGACPVMFVNISNLIDGRWVSSQARHTAHYSCDVMRFDSWSIKMSVFISRRINTSLEANGLKCMSHGQFSSLLQKWVWPFKMGGQGGQMAFAIIPLLYLSFSLALSQKPIWLIKCFVCSVALIHFGHVIGSGYKPGTRSH